MLWKFKDLNFKFQSPESPPLLAVTFHTQGLEVNINLHAALNASAQNSKIGINLDILIEDIILVKTCLYKIKHKALMEDYQFFSIFL